MNNSKQYIKVTKTPVKIIAKEQHDGKKMIKKKDTDIDTDSDVEIDDRSVIKKKEIMVNVINLKKEAKIIKGYENRSIDDIRKARGKEQKIFLILTHEYDADDLERKYEVMGTTGNVYTVSILNTPTCTCPDYVSRNKRCKHIYFVLTRIMKVKSSQEDIEEYSDGDLEDMFENIPQITENLRIDANRLAKFRILKKNGNNEVEKRELDDESMCPICLTELCDCDEELIYCRYSCGYSLHKQCFDMYNSKQHGQFKCIFCQKPWELGIEGRYLNIDL
jgi:hypothetical protein